MFLEVQVHKVESEDSDGKTPPGEESTSRACDEVLLGIFSIEALGP